MLLLLFACGCAAEVTPGMIFSAYGVETVTPEDCYALDIEYLQVSKTNNPYALRITGTQEEFTQLVNAMLAGVHQKEAPAAPFSPEASAEARIDFCVDGEARFTFLYDADTRTLSFRNSSMVKEKLVYYYEYFTVDETFSALLAAQEANAAFAQDDTVEPYVSVTQLKESIDREDLEGIGDEVEYRFYEGEVPKRDVTACSVYSSRQAEGLAGDELLVVAYGQDNTARQQELWILSVEENDFYIKVYVMAPDQDVIDSVEAGSASNAVVISLEDISHDKWMVFIDEDFNVTDVLRPQDYLPEA